MRDKVEVLDATVVERINSLNQTEMARLWRYAPAGHIYFDCNLPYYKLFEKRFALLGGMTSSISKLIDE